MAGRARRDLYPVGFNQLLHLARTRQERMASTPRLRCTHTLCTAGPHHRYKKQMHGAHFLSPLSSTGQQSDETLHVQWFGRLVENT